MKAALAVILQFLLFLAVFASGIILGVFNPLHLRWFFRAGAPGSGPAYFDPTGLLLTLLLYLLILAIEASRKSLRTAGLRTSIALLLAIVVGVCFRFGFVS